MLVRESPMLHRVQWLFLITAQVKVVPEKSVSIVVSARKVHQAWESDGKQGAILLGWGANGQRGALDNTVMEIYL
jgi:hypothetical protein